MDRSALLDILAGDGPFVTVHVPSGSDVDGAEERYELEWKLLVRDLAEQGVDERTCAAVLEARGEEPTRAARYVVVTQPDAEVRIAVPLSRPPRRPLVLLAPLPHLVPLLEEESAHVPHLIVRVDRAGADVTASYGSDATTGEFTVIGDTVDIRTVPVGAWSQLHYQRRVEEDWEADARDVAGALDLLADRIHAELVVAAGDDAELDLIRRHLSTRLQPMWVQVEGGRSVGGEGQVDELAADAVGRHVAGRAQDVLADFARERGKRAAEGLDQVVATLGRSEVATLLLTASAAAAPEEDGPLLWFGPEFPQIALTYDDTVGMGLEAPVSAAQVDVLTRAALGTGADVLVVADELAEAPAGGVGALLRD